MLLPPQVTYGVSHDKVKPLSSSETSCALQLLC